MSGKIFKKVCDEWEPFKDIQRNFAFYLYLKNTQKYDDKINL
jgi:hypothetical protein